MTSNKRPDVQDAIDTRLNDALTTANYRITLNNQKQNARLKLQKDLTFSQGGGTFVISPEFISFISTLVNLGKDEAILLDVNSNPILVEDLSAFMDKVIEIYYECMNQFLVEFKSINKQRTVKSLVGA